MPYCRLDSEGRMAEWSRDKLDHLDVEFSNGDYVDANCVDGLEDFVIENGEAVFRPLPEKEIARLKGNLQATDWVACKMLDELRGAKSLGDLLAVFAAFSEEYADEFASRQVWRDRINELEE